MSETNNVPAAPMATWKKVVIGLFVLSAIGRMIPDKHSDSGSSASTSTSTSASTECIEKGTFDNMVTNMVDSTPSAQSNRRAATMMATIINIAAMDRMGDKPCSDWSGWWNSNIDEIRRNPMYIDTARKYSR
jgi:hypothetical protein